MFNIRQTALAAIFVMWGIASAAPPKQASPSHQYCSNGSSSPGCSKNEGGKHTGWYICPDGANSQPTYHFCDAGYICDLARLKASPNGDPCVR
ncbi:hypothetical protein EV182_007000, partial [Spiromyces aspiralis]